MFPLDLMPPFLRTISYLVPHSWALAGYQNLLVRGQGLEQVLPQVAVLLLFAALFFLIAIRRFDFEA
jgi:ABC-type multidrug transport system permease subunit